MNVCIVVVVRDVVDGSIEVCGEVDDTGLGCGVVDGNIVGEVCSVDVEIGGGVE